MMKEKNKFQQLTSENICEIYNILHSEGLVSFPLTKEATNKIESLVANINGSSFSVPHYPSNEERAIAYFYFIIKDHPFTDGNKRTATLVFLVVSSMNGLRESLMGYDLDALAVYLEQLKVPDHQKAIKILSEAVFNETS